MVKKITIKGIAFVVLMLSIVLIAMAAGPGITINNPPATVNVNYANVTVTTTGTTGIVYLSWNGGINETMQGSGNSFFLNKIGLTDGTTYNFIVYANDSTPNNWSSASGSVKVILATPTYSAPSFTSGPSNDTPTASNVNISFRLNQSNAHTSIEYGTTAALGIWGSGDNSSLSDRIIPLSGLSQGQTYYYSVFAYNGSDQSYFTNSTINTFTT